jgi:LemA protein
MGKGAIIVVAIVVLALILGVATYNRLVGLSQAVTSQWAQVENVYQRRADLIPNLVATVQGAANFEKSTLEAVTNARASVGKLQGPGADVLNDPEAFARWQQAQSALSGALSRLLAVAEAYPDLKASAAFRDLQTQLEGTENRITVERRRFNEVAQDYNTARQKFPTVLLAGMLGFRERPYFQAEPGAEKPPQVKFDFGAPSPSPSPAH